VIAGNIAIAFSERGAVPDLLMRAGIRRLLRQRLAEVGGNDPEVAAQHCETFAAAMWNAPIALQPQRANQQHYELPPEFFAQVLGTRRKYSSAWWPEGVTQLDQAEEYALAATCERAGLRDGQSILELGCGWGSLTLWMAERYPHSQILALSNSHSQRTYIETEMRQRGLRNVSVVTGDVTLFNPAAQFDRIVSVEMFEHLRNWPEMFRRVAGWLADDGRFFMHVFAHCGAPYAFEERDASDWMTRHFFAGGMMPSDDLALTFQDHLRCVKRWRWDGTHYQRTAESWLANLDANRTTVQPLLENSYGNHFAAQWFQRWRVFFMSCAELFGYNRGRQWWVSHYLFERRLPTTDRHP